MDQFTEATLIAKPIIYISLQELYDTHVLLLEHLDSIAPNRKDPLRELLEDLGDSPSICSLLGKDTVKNLRLEEKQGWNLDPT